MLSAGEKKSVDEVQTEEDASDTEGMIESFVQVKFPTTVSKLHRPLVDSAERDPSATPAPVCGAKGTYTFVPALDVLEGPPDVAIYVSTQLPVPEML